MKGKTKSQLVAAVTVAIVIVLAVWYATYPRQKYHKLASLQRITFSPPSTGCVPACGAGAACIDGACTAPAPPLLTFAFGEAVDPQSVGGTTASLKSFTIDPDTPAATAAAAAKLIETLLARGGAPFTPVLSSPTTVTTNTIPRTLLEAGVNTPISFNGSGVMWFAVPMKGPTP